MSVQKVDVHHQSDRTAMCLTFTCSGDFPVIWERNLASWHAKKCDSSLIVREGGEDEEEHLHYHSVGTFKTSNPSNLSKACEVLYRKNNLDWVKGVSVCVKKCTDLIGWWYYLLKSVEGDVLQIMGWKMSFIKEQMKMNVSKIPFKILMKDKYVLRTKSATARCMAYAKAIAHVVSGKDSFASLICIMAEDGYQFEQVKMKWLYCQMMSLMGDQRAMRSMVMNELHFLE